MDDNDHVLRISKNSIQFNKIIITSSLKIYQVWVENTKKLDTLGGKVSDLDETLRKRGGEGIWILSSNYNVSK
jgi:hypothetical protein